MIVLIALCIHYMFSKKILLVSSKFENINFSNNSGKIKIVIKLLHINLNYNHFMQQKNIFPKQQYYVPFYNTFASFLYILCYCISTHFMPVFHFYIPCKRQNLRKVKCTSLCINPIQDGPFRGYSWMVWTKRLPLSKICNTYYPTMKLGATYGWCGQKGSYSLKICNTYVTQ